MCSFRCSKIMFFKRVKLPTTNFRIVKIKIPRNFRDIAPLNY